MTPGGSDSPRLCISVTGGTRPLSSRWSQRDVNGGFRVRIQPVEATHFDGALEVKPLGGVFSAGFMEVLVVA